MPIEIYAAPTCAGDSVSSATPLGAPTGERNALVDVPGVLGHRTLVDGDRLRTGVTAILPHGGNLYAEKVLGACHTINGYGKAAGLSQLAELGTIESPLLLTSTLSVGPVWEGGLSHVLAANPEAAVDRDTVNVIVAECFDGWLSDARALAVRPEHALEAIAAARPTRTARARSARAPAPPASVKAGIGGASRRTEAHVVGCLVCSNYGARRDLHMLVGPVDIDEDAPSRRRRRVDRDRAGHRRPALGASAAPPGGAGDVRAGPAGGFGANASGEYALASRRRTGSRTADRRPPELRLCATTRALRELFEATAEVVHEAVSTRLLRRRDGRARRQPAEALRTALDGAPGLRPIG